MAPFAELLTPFFLAGVAVVLPSDELPSLFDPVPAVSAEGAGAGVGVTVGCDGSGVATGAWVVALLLYAGLGLVLFFPCTLVLAGGAASTGSCG